MLIDTRRVSDHVREREQPFEEVVRVDRELLDRHHGMIEFLLSLVRIGARSLQVASGQKSEAMLDVYDFSKPLVRPAGE
jgi:hypothetical protein